jgi:cytochrome o ubiquinol oxidase subunit IV
MTHEPNLDEIQKEYHGTLKSYIIGFTASLLLTLLAFGLVIAKSFPKHLIILSIVALGLIQAVFQLRFFLKLGYEAKPRWETIVFYCMILVLLIIAIGSLWIMHDLNLRMMNMSTM